MILDLKYLPRNPHLIGKFSGDHKLKKVAAAETAEEFAVLQTAPLILREGRGFFMMTSIILKNTEKHEDP